MDEKLRPASPSSPLSSPWDEKSQGSANFKGNNDNNKSVTIKSVSRRD